VSFDEFYSLFKQCSDAITVRDAARFRSIANRQIGLLELAGNAIPLEARDQLLTLWRGAESVLAQQMATVLPAGEQAKIDSALTKQARAELLHNLVCRAAVVSSSANGGARRAGVVLIVLGGASLLFSWPWGALVGAVLVLAGVIAVTIRSATLDPDEKLRAVRSAGADSFEAEDWVKRYEAAIADNTIRDLSPMNRSIREQFGWPERGSIAGYPGASAEMETMLTTIEASQGRVPIRQAIVFLSILDPEGPEAFFLRERDKRGYPPL
jgi:hypothetical protein